MQTLIRVTIENGKVYSVIAAMDRNGQETYRYLVQEIVEDVPFVVLYETTGDRKTLISLFDSKREKPYKTK